MCSERERPRALSDDEHAAVRDAPIILAPLKVGRGGVVAGAVSGAGLGLGAFAVVGANAAITSGATSLPIAAVCGMLTATCGGLVRG